MPKTTQKWKIREEKTLKIILKKPFKIMGGEENSKETTIYNHVIWLKQLLRSIEEEFLRAIRQGR